MKLIAARLTNGTFHLLNLNRHNYKNGAKLVPALECPSQNSVTFTLYLCNYSNSFRVGVESRSENARVAPPPNTHTHESPFAFFSYFFFQDGKGLRWPFNRCSNKWLAVSISLSYRGVRDIWISPEFHRCIDNAFPASTELWLLDKHISCLVFDNEDINRKQFYK